jgi:hypothetical protein
MEAKEQEITGGADKMKQITCFVIENWESSREKIVNGLQEKLQVKPGNISVFNDLDACLKALKRRKKFKKMHFKKLETLPQPDLVIADLYRAEKKEDRNPHTVYQRIKNKRIRKLEELRLEIGRQSIIVVISQYVEFFFRELGTEGEKYAGDISNWLNESPAKIDLIVDKYKNSEIQGMYSKIAGMLTRR